MTQPAPVYGPYTPLRTDRLDPELAEQFSSAFYGIHAAQERYETAGLCDSEPEEYAALDEAHRALRTLKEQEIVRSEVEYYVLNVLRVSFVAPWSNCALFNGKCPYTGHIPSHSEPSRRAFPAVKVADGLCPPQGPPLSSRLLPSQPITHTGAWRYRLRGVDPSDPSIGDFSAVFCSQGDEDDSETYESVPILNPTWLDVVVQSNVSVIADSLRDPVVLAGLFIFSADPAPATIERPHPSVPEFRIRMVHAG